MSTLEAAVTYRGHGLGHLAADNRSMRTLCGARVHSLAPIDLPDDGNLCKRCERIAVRTHDQVKEADEDNGRPYTVAWRPKTTGSKPALLPKQAGRKERVAWIRAALGATAAAALADATDRQVGAFYRYLSSLPDERFQQPTDELRCLRCGEEVRLDVHYHCPCGVDQAVLQGAEPDDDIS